MSSAEDKQSEERLAELLTLDRLDSYMSASATLHEALVLYDWNVEACAAVLATSAMVEVVVRNAMDSALTDWAIDLGQDDWLKVVKLDRIRKRDIAEAQRRSSRHGSDPPHGKVLSELSFGFWRYLAARRYLTSLWMPSLRQAFPNGTQDPLHRQRSVEKAMERLVFVRNRAAHHEPIHRRDLSLDLEITFNLARMVDPVACDWISARSPIPEVVAGKPHTRN